MQLEPELTSEFNMSIQYKYVPTGQNPVNLITRDLSTTKLKDNLEYWTFLATRSINFLA